MLHLQRPSAAAAGPTNEAATANTETTLQINTLDYTDNNPKHTYLTYEDLLQLRNWSEYASCYAWMHKESHRFYTRLMYFIRIPFYVLLFTTGGTGVRIAAPNDSNGSEEETQTWLGGIVIAISVYLSVMLSVDTVMKVGENIEAHQNAKKLFSRYMLNLDLRLSNPKYQRGFPGQILKMAERDMNEMMKNQPQIPAHIEKRFKKWFGADPNLHIPPVIGGPRPAIINLNHVEKCNAEQMEQAVSVDRKQEAPASPPKMTRQPQPQPIHQPLETNSLPDLHQRERKQSSTGELTAEEKLSRIQASANGVSPPQPPMPRPRQLSSHRSSPTLSKTPSSIYIVRGQKPLQ